MTTIATAPLRERAGRVGPPHPGDEEQVPPGLDEHDPHQHAGVEGHPGHRHHVPPLQPPQQEGEPGHEPQQHEGPEPAALPAGHHRHRVRDHRPQRGGVAGQAAGGIPGTDPARPARAARRRRAAGGRASGLSWSSDQGHSEAVNCASGRPRRPAPHVRGPVNHGARPVESLESPRTPRHRPRTTPYGPARRAHDRVRSPARPGPVSASAPTLAGGGRPTLSAVPPKGGTQRLCERETGTCTRGTTPPRPPPSPGAARPARSPPSTS